MIKNKPRQSSINEQLEASHSGFRALKAALPTTGYIEGVKHHLGRSELIAWQQVGDRVSVALLAPPTQKLITPGHEVSLDVTQLGGNGRMHFYGKVSNAEESADGRTWIAIDLDPIPEGTSIMDDPRIYFDALSISNERQIEQLGAPNPREKINPLVEKIIAGVGIAAFTGILGICAAKSHNEREMCDAISNGNDVSERRYYIQRPPLPGKTLQEVIDYCQKEYKITIDPNFGQKPFEDAQKKYSKKP